MSQSPVIDSEAIENLRALSPDDGDVFLKEILGIFIEDTPGRIAELHSSRASGNLPSFTRAAHSIKGSSSNVGAIELKAIAEKLEQQSKQQGFANTESLVAEIESAFARARECLQKLIA